MTATYPRPHKYDKLPAAGKRMARVPRYGRLIGMLPTERFETLTDEASLLWEVYTYRTADTDPNAMTGLLDDGLKTDGARRLGWYGQGEPPTTPLFRKHQVRRACDLLGAIAFEMLAAQPHPVFEIDSDYEVFQQGVLNRFLDAGAHVNSRGKPELAEHQERISEDWECLFAMNSHGLEHFIFPTDPRDKRLRWTDITTMAFFAAYWACRWATSAELELTKAWVVDPLEDVDGDDEIAKATSQTFREFWTFAAELPDEAMRDVLGTFDLSRWRSLFEPLYDPTIKRNPVVDYEGRPIRSTEFIWRSWPRMEQLEKGKKTKESLIDRFRGVAAKEAAESLQAGFIALAPSDKPGDIGEFWMGAGPHDASESPDEQPRHRVKLSSYALHEHCLTNKAYELFDERHKEHRWWGGDNHPSVTADGDGADELCPVVNVSWYDAAVYALWLGAVRIAGEENCIALPTEAQWEYACRCESGRETPFSFKGHDGLSATPDICNFNGNYLWPKGTKLPKMAREEDVYRKRTIEVCALGKNDWGFYQMHGNVWEWCRDWYAESFYSSPDAEKPDPINEEKASFRVLRGGSWDYGAGDCRSAFRLRDEPDLRYFNCGFRLAAVPVLEPSRTSESRAPAT